MGADERGYGTGARRTLAHAELTACIIGAFFDVYNELGSGFLEAVYRRALAVVLREKGLSVRQEVPFDISFHGVNVGNYRADLLVGDLVLVETKAVECIHAAHEAQVLNYLRVTGLTVGLLLNFGPRPSFKRLVHSARSIRVNPPHQI